MTRELSFRIPVLAVLVAIASAPWVGAEVGQAEQAAQDPAIDELEALRRALAQPGGGEARREREAAVDALLRRREPEAHELLAAVVEAGEDADRTASYVLRSLDRIVSQPVGTVFAEPESRAAVLRIHVPAIVRLFADEAASPTQRNVAPLRPLGRRVLARLTFLDRRDRFQELMAAGDPELARATLRAAGASRDIALVEWIAQRLDDPDLAPAAREALRTLTFIDRPFTDSASFEAWFADYRDLDYVDFVERAAGRAEELADGVRAEAEKQIVAQTVKLVAALARAAEPDWKAIAAEVLPGPGRVGTDACMGTLRDALAERVESGTGPKGVGGVVQDRLALAREIRSRLQGLRDQPQAFALYLETFAYLAVRDDAEQRREVEQQLLAALGSDDPVVQRAAFRGLRRFPSITNRAKVVEAAIAAHGAGDAESLSEALACLRAPGWSAPAPADADRAGWIALVRSVLEDAQLDARLRERALDIAVLRDASDTHVQEMFDVLLAQVQAPERDVQLRKWALLRLVAFSRDEALAARYVESAIELLADPDAGMRRLAAQQLVALPEASQARRAVWLSAIVDRCAVRLREESEELALREVLNCLLHAAEQSASANGAMTALVEVAKQLAGRPANEDRFRRDVVVDGLRILGVSRAREIAFWLPAAESLARLGARAQLREILDRQDVGELAGAGGELVSRAMQVVIDAALLATADSDWSSRAAEAEQVRRAFEVLDGMSMSATDSADRALRVEVLAALGRPSEVVKVGAAVLDDTANALTAEDRSRVQRAVACANLDLAQLDQAQRRLGELDLSNGAVPADLALWVRLAQQRLRTEGGAAAAVEILTRVLSRTPIDDAAWRDRFLLLADARLQADPKSREVVLKDLHAEHARFTGDGVPAETATRYAALVRRAEGQG